METPEYTQGIMSDGPVILKDGQPMTPEAIVAELNYLTFSVQQADRTIDNVVRVASIWENTSMEYAEQMRQSEE